MTIESGLSPWLARTQPNPQASLRLFCFPYAGGGATIYHSWPASLPPTVEVCGIQLPGRGSRLKEKPYTRASPLIESLAVEMAPYLDRPFAFFGHSLGAMISFELAHRLRGERGLEPAHLFVSGRRAPQLPKPDRDIYQLPEPEFIEQLRRLNGTPREVLEHPELMGVMIPSLRADFEMSETYVYSARPPLRCPITALGGLEDEEVTRPDLEAWRAQTSGPFSLRLLPGDHFFLHSSKSVILQLISRGLDEAVRAPDHR